MSRRQFLAIILALLLLLLAVLVYLYLSLVRPPGSEGPAKVAGITHIKSIYGYGTSKKSQLNKPIGIGVDSEDRIIVADSGNERVLVFNSNGGYVGKLGKNGMDKGKYKHPTGIGVGPNDDIYVCDDARQMVLVYNKDFKFKTEIPEMQPIDVFVKGTKIYVAAWSHISIYSSKNYKLIDKWGKRGKRHGEFDFPHGIVVLKNNVVVVSDGNNMRLQALLNSSGDTAWVVGKPPKDLKDTNREFGLPAGMTLDKDENIYVCDPLRSTIHVFNKDGKRLAELGEIGNKDGQFYYPSDIAYLGGNEFAITDTNNDRVQIVRISFKEK